MVATGVLDDRRSRLGRLKLGEQLAYRVAADIIATVQAVAAAPPPRFAGGGQWQVPQDR